MHHKKRLEETRVCISLYRLLTVEPPDLLSSSLVSHVTSARDARACKSREVAWPTFVHSWCMDLWVRSETETVRCSSRSWAWNC